jgi:hypothetical protein
VAVISATLLWKTPTVMVVFRVSLAVRVLLAAVAAVVQYVVAVVVVDTVGIERTLFYLEAR